MRAVLQRVSSARVTVDGEIVGAIGPGLLVLLGIQEGDTPADVAWLAPKTAQLRIFEDAAGKMNLSLLDLVAGGTSKVSPAQSAAPASSALVGANAPAVLVVSQFTLLASTRKGTRPSFNGAAAPAVAIPLYEAFVRELETLLGRAVATGRFGASMQVALVNDGPVTLILDSRLRE